MSEGKTALATIDVLLPVKNALQFLPAALDSIICQTFRDWRLILLDHGSDDGSLDLAQSYADRDRRIKVHCFPEANGLSALLNRGLNLCDCRYVLRHDADDIAYPDRMECSISAFRENPSDVAIGGQADLIDEDGVLTGVMKRPIDRIRISAGCLFWNPIIHPTVTMDFVKLKKAGAGYGFDFLNLVDSRYSLDVPRWAQDYFLFGQLALLGSCTNIPNKVIKYRRHGGSVGSRHFSAQMDVSLKISRFLMRSFCASHNVPYVDPAPFCNHGGSLFAIESRKNFAEEFEHLSFILRKGFGHSESLEREIDYRRSISTRRHVSLLLRYAQFSLKHSPEDDERNAVREWMIGRIRGRSRLTVSLDD